LFGKIYGIDLGIKSDRGMSSTFKGFNFGTDYVNQLVTTTHELFHLITLELFGENITETIKANENPKQHLQRVILETVSLWAEGYAQAELGKIATEEQQGFMTRRGQHRMTYFADGLNGAIGICYGLGAALALDWNQNGWHINQLPQLVEMIKQVLANYGLNLDKTQVLMVNEDLSSTFQQVYQDLKRLKPREGMQTHEFVTPPRSVIKTIRSFFNASS